MDVMRSAYRTKMRLFKDSDREDWVRWYPAPLPAKIFPGWHLFASQNWMRDKALEWTGPGEVKGAPRQFVTGRNPPCYIGECHVGEDQWFREGMPGSALLQPIADLPPCCGIDPCPFAGLSGFGNTTFVYYRIPPPAPPPVLYTMTVAGVFNAACTDCANLNRQWSFSAHPTLPHAWQSDAVPICETSTGAWLLRQVIPGLWRLEFGAFQMVYQVNNPSWEGTTPLTLGRTTIAAQCAGFPDLLTVEPVAIV